MIDRKMLFASALAGAALLSTPAGAAAILATFDVSGLGLEGDGTGIAIAPNGDIVLTAFLSSNNTQSLIVQVTSDFSAVVDSDLVDLNGVHGITFLPNGNALLSNSETGAASGLYEYDLATDAIVAAGVRLVTDPPAGDADGVAIEPGTGNFWIADDTDEAIYEFDAAGVLQSTIFTAQLQPTPDTAIDEPEGITFDPLTGNIFFADDSAGTRRIYEITTAGVVVQDFALSGADDPSGLEFDPVNRVLWVIDNNNEVVLRVDPFAVPAPGPLALLGAGLIGLGLARRRSA